MRWLLVLALVFMVGCESEPEDLIEKGLSSEQKDEVRGLIKYQVNEKGKRDYTAGETFIKRNIHPLDKKIDALYNHLKLEYIEKECEEDIVRGK